MKHSRFPRGHWRSVRLAVWNRARGKGTIPACEVCSKPAEQGEAAHLHPLQRGRSRENPDARCSICGTLLNHPDNVRWVCRSMINDCHEVLDKNMRPECRRT